jgi:hypothetical protein
MPCSPGTRDGLAGGMGGALFDVGQAQRFTGTLPFTSPRLSASPAFPTRCRRKLSNPSAPRACHGCSCSIFSPRSATPQSVGLSRWDGGSRGPALSFRPLSQAHPYRRAIPRARFSVPLKHTSGGSVFLAHPFKKFGVTPFKRRLPVHQS